MVAASVCF
jgi:hypothetical protein